MSLTKGLILACLFASLIVLTQAYGAVPSLQPIPAGLPKIERAAFEQRAAKLQAQLADLKERNAAFLAKYGAGVPENSPEATAAEKEQAALEKDMNAYVAAAERFNQDVQHAVIAPTAPPPENKQP